MKRGKVGVLMLCLILCFSVVYSAGAASQLSAKQLLLNKLKSWEPGPAVDLNESFSGTATYAIKELSGLLISEEPLKSLAGAQLKVNYGFIFPQKKIKANYELGLNQGRYKGVIYLEDNRLIMPSNVFSLVELFDPEFYNNELSDLPDYVYLSDPELTEFWNEMYSFNMEEMLLDYKELLVFIVEAVPEKYFTASLANQKITFSLDQDGLEDVLLHILQKVKNEDERFAELVASILSSIDPKENKEDVKGEILDELEKAVQDPDFPDSADELQELREFISVKQLSWEIPLLPGGQNKFTMDLGIGDKDFSAGIKVDAVSSGPSDNTRGTLTIEFEVQDDKQDKMNGQVSLEFHNQQTDKKAKSNATLRVQASDSSTSTTLLNLLLETQSDEKVDQNLQINIPLLTESNSVDLNKYFKKPSGLSVLVDGVPVHFDVAPFIKDDRTMVPLRDFAEAMGCEVTWTGPDRIDLTREDISITMYIENPSYTASGVEKTMDVPPFIKDERTMVPLRSIAEEFGCLVQYDEETQTVFINTQYSTHWAYAGQAKSIF